MSVKISNKGEVLYCSISGEIDHHSAGSIRKAIDDAANSAMPNLLVLDFAGVTFMDSSGIGLVMGRYRNISKQGGKVHISNPSPYIHKLMHISGIERIATMDPVREEESYR
ncbi:MAG: anti-sigma factor antagonist [Clostridia bacterium]|nr:anti-sigma factor antagonist [Clostridia bacterium]